MSGAERHKKQVSDYLSRHKDRQKQGYASPKNANRARQPIHYPPLEKLSIDDVSPSSNPSKRGNSQQNLASKNHQVRTTKHKGDAKGYKLPLGQVQPARTTRTRATIYDMPSELLLRIFSFLPPSDLLTCVCVNKQWLELASDNILWQPLYKQYATPASGKSSARSKKDSPTKSHPVYSLHADVKWKKACIKACVEKRNLRITTLLKKRHPYSLLPANTEKTIQKLGIQWQLILTDCNKMEHSFTHSDAFHFHTSTTVRWYSLNPPPIRSLCHLSVYAVAPIFFNKDGSAATDSPCQRSVLTVVDIKPGMLTGEPTIHCDVINMYTLESGIILATWKDGGELAFLSVCLHNNGIIQRSVLGTSEHMYIPTPVKPKPDDVDLEYGLHDYTCIIELRHQRTVLWSQQFTHLHSSKQDKVDGFARMTPVRGDVISDHSYTTKKLQFPWKTDVFKGIVKDFAILDCTVYDEFQQPMWCISSPIVISCDDKVPVTMDYDGDPCVIRYSDHRGNIEIRMYWIPDREQHIVVAVNVDISLETINGWFGTHY